MLNMQAVKESTAGLSEIESEYIARSLMRDSPTVTPQHTCFEVLDVLARHPEVIGLPVLENGFAIGLINRGIFNDEMAKPFRRDLYGRKSCIAFMDKQPLVVPETMSIQDVSFKVIESGGKTLNDGFIIVNPENQYLGIGTGEDLVKVVSFLQAEKNRLVMESINYASVIQKSFMRSSRDDLASMLKDYFMHWEPRDKVGGDYFFCKKFNDGFFMALMDCTGHGVPGAFMTLIMAAFMDHLLQDNNRTDPAGALGLINRKVKTALGQISEDNVVPIHPEQHERSDDGMDAAFIWVDQANNKMVFAGAKTPLFCLPAGEADFVVVDGDKKGVGYTDTPLDYAWTNKTVELSKGDMIYLTTDGIIDQIGGLKKIAFGKKRLMQLLLKHRVKSMEDQCEAVLRNYYEYQGNQRRRDDVSFFGFRHN